MRMGRAASIARAHAVGTAEPQAQRRRGFSERRNARVQKSQDERYL